MSNNEHLFAVVEATPEGESTLDLAKDVVGRGGHATVVVVFSKPALADIRSAAASEDLGFVDAADIFMERILDRYAATMDDRAACDIVVVEESPKAVFAQAERVHATSIAVPQSLTRTRRWRSAASHSRVPVTVTSPVAA